MSRTHRLLLSAVLISPIAFTAACGSSNTAPLSGGAAKGMVVVGSSNFPENELIAEIYAQALRAKGVNVTTKPRIGAREIYYPQVKSGAISVIPDYNGTLLTVSVNPSSTAATTSDVDAALRAGLPPTLEILNPAPAQDKDSVTVTQATASRYHLASIGDLRPVSKTMTFGGPPEFKTRADGLAGLQKHYGVTFKAFDPLDESGPITLAALRDGKVQAADVFTTTPQITTDKLVPLADPKSNFAAQNVVPLVYKKAMTPTITRTLNEVSARLTTQALIQMNNAIIVQHANYSDVAAGFLKATGLSLSGNG